MIRFAKTGGRYLSSLEPHALAGIFSAISAATMLTCLCLNMPVLFDISNGEISGAVTIKLWDGKTFYLEPP